jgi:uncharacterized protein YdeI (YjbR/CyaY-like superfamily)
MKVSAPPQFQMTSSASSTATPLPRTTAFAQLDARNRYSIIWRLSDAKRPATHARLPAQYLEMLRRGERLHD